MLSLVVAAKRIAMLKRWTLLSIIAVTSSILTPVSTAIVPEHLSVQSEVPASRLARLRHGINLSHWFAQSADDYKSNPKFTAAMAEAKQLERERQVFFAIDAYKKASKIAQGKDSAVFETIFTLQMKCTTPSVPAT